LSYFCITTLGALESLGPRFTQSPKPAVSTSLHKRPSFAAYNISETLVLKVKKAKADIAPHGNPTSELQDVTCHMGSHSVTCHPTQVNVPCRLVLDLPTPEGWKA